MRKDWKQCSEASILHYVKPPENHIVIDFDIARDDAAHLHYIYDGDVTLLSDNLGGKKE